MLGFLFTEVKLLLKQQSLNIVQTMIDWTVEKWLIDQTCRFLVFDKES
jgi:hypothetical protein